MSSRANGHPGFMDPAAEYVALAILMISIFRRWERLDEAPFAVIRRRAF